MSHTHHDPYLVERLLGLESPFLVDISKEKRQGGHVPVSFRYSRVPRLGVQGTKGPRHQASDTDDTTDGHLPRETAASEAE